MNNLTELLKLTRPLVCLDCETTGTDVRKDRIVELGYKIFYPNGEITEFRTYVDPEISMPPGAYDVHGISAKELTSCATCGKAGYAHEETGHAFIPCPTFKELAKGLAEHLSGCDFLGKSVRFDLRIIDAEMRRAGVKWSYAGARIIDADRLEQLGDPRTLSDLVRKHLGREHDGAHGAISDVRASVEVIEAQLIKYAKVLPHDLAALHELQWPGRIDVDGKFVFVNNVPTIRFGKHAGMAMRDAPRDYWSWMAGPKADFTPEEKKIALEAAMGKFPSLPKTPLEEEEPPL